MILADAPEGLPDHAAALPPPLPLWISYPVLAVLSAMIWLAGWTAVLALLS